MRLARDFRDQLGQLVALVLPAPLSPPLSLAHHELRRSLHLAFGLATTHGRVVSVAPVLGGSHDARALCLSFRLPEGVRWGRPAAVPLPPALCDSRWRGGRPRPLSILPHRRAAANVWFLHHGREALCLRLGLGGQAEFLRYRPRLGAWTRA